MRMFPPARGSAPAPGPAVGGRASDGGMRICLVQIRSENGSVGRNLERHLRALRSTAAMPAGLIVFPELSLSNYDPGGAEAAALTPADPRLEPLQRFADACGTVVGVGAPLRTAGLPIIAMLVFAPGRPVGVIGKQHLHPDELPFFSPAPVAPDPLPVPLRIGVAICWELSVEAHVSGVMDGGSALFLASVAKTAAGVTEGHRTLARIARSRSVPALMVNCVGTCEGKPAGGGSTVLDRSGRTIARLDGDTEGVLLYDVSSGAAVAEPMPGAWDP